MTKYSGLEIAVIGMSCRFPDADNVSEYWNNLQNGANCISTLTDAELLAEKESPALLKNKQYVKANAYLKKKGFFDSAFFGYRDEEAQLMNPQTRLYHECCWEAIEDSGYSLDTNKHKVGIFAAGAANVPWILNAVANNKEGLVDDFTAMHLRDVNFLSSTIAYKFNLKGPAVMVQTACSSSLVAVHEACNSLLLGECNLALAGGINVQHYSHKGYMYKEGAILSQDGNCRPFSSDSSGTVVGEGAGVVVLKRLKDAIKDNDHIYAIIKGTAVNNDGNNKIGYTAPSVAGQTEVIQKAQKIADVEPHTIGYVEAHGTATSLGDPVEVEALNQAFNNNPDKHCALGSVKSNIGHADTAAGIAGFIKAVLAINNKKIPATLHFENPNPKIDFNNGPFYVNKELIEWNNSQYPLRAGVSSFGIGGTNAHVVLEQAPESVSSVQDTTWRVLTLSAKTKKSLERNTSALKNYLTENPQANLGDIAYTLQAGRNRFEHRRILTCETIEEAISKITNKEYLDFKGNSIREDLQNIVFLFPGQGAQYTDMCKGLYSSNTVFKQTVDNCLSIAANYSNSNFKATLFPETSDSGELSINDTVCAQPLLFIIEYALAKVLDSWGIKPDYMIGHSIGEYVAACISGVFSLQDAIKLVIRRGELMGSVPRGSMLSVTMNHAELKPLLVLHKQIDIAVINTDVSVVVAGESGAIAAFEKELSAQGIETKKLHTSHAFHSSMMDDILEGFEQEVNAVSINTPQIPYISNITGERVTYELIKNASYWSDHLRNTVQFNKGSETLLKLGGACFIELGPGRTLSNYITANNKKGENHLFINTVRQSNQAINDQHYLLEKLGDFWLKGLKINWDTFYDDQPKKKLSLPTYSFEKIPYATDFNLDELLNTRLSTGGAATSYPDSGIYATDWKKSLLPNHANELNKKHTSFVVFSGSQVFGRSVIELLNTSGQEVIEVRAGNEFKLLRQNIFELNYNNEDDLIQLWEHLANQQTQIGNIIHCGSLTSETGTVVYEVMERRMAGHYLHFALLAKSLALWNPKNTVDVTLVTNHLAKVMAQDVIDPLKAAIQAPAAIMPSEIENINCRIIDIPYASETDSLTDNYVQQVINEVFYHTDEHFVAYRHGERWVKHYEPVVDNEKIRSGATITNNGTYIVTGGFGGMGFTIAQDLAHRHHANLILVHRSSFPQREEWDMWLETKGINDETGKKIEAILKIEAAGSKVDLYQVDIANEAEVKDFADRIANKYPTVSGLIWAAGQVDYGGIMMNRSSDDFIKYTTSKVAGLLLFQKYLNFNSFDFIALFSSIGNDFYQMKFGQVAYNAANEFLESYAKYAQATIKSHVFAINWCDWYNVGMTVKTLTSGAADVDLDAINSKIHDGIYPDEGIKIFYNCLENKIPAYSIHKGDILQEIKRNRKRLKDLRNNTKLIVDSAAGEIKAGENTEQSLLDIFRKFFSNGEISDKDNFFELGGDSLKAMTLVGRINQALGTNITIRDLYKNPAIGSLAKKLNKQEGHLENNIIPTAPEKDLYEISSEQKRMFFLQMYNPESTAYNEIEIVHISGNINFEKIEQLFTQILDKNESLRTEFILENGIPKQKIVQSFNLDIQYLTLTGNSGWQEAVTQFVKPFDLSNGPLYRVGVIEREPGSYTIIMDSHHIVVDGTSKHLITEQFKALYNNETLPEQPVQYKDYAEWQQGPEQRSVIEKQKSFWMNEFADEPQKLDLLTDYPRTANPDYKGASFRFDLSPETTAALKAIAITDGTTLYTVLLAAYYVFLNKISNQDDIVIGTPVSGRLNTDLEQVVGMFVKTLPLRNAPNPELSFNEFVATVSSKNLACFENQAYPFDELVDALNLERDLDRNPLFDVFFVYHKADGVSKEVPGLSITLDRSQHLTTKLDLTLSAVELQGKLNLEFVYARALFNEESIRRFSVYFENIVMAVVNNSRIRIAEVDVLPIAEKNILLERCNQTRVHYNEDDTVLSLFLEQVKSQPQNLAVSFADEKLTYAQLNNKANTIAQIIRQYTNNQKSRVGLLFKSSTEMIISLLAVLKAGCAYIPLSAEAPAERNRYILENGSAELLLIQEDLYEKQYPDNLLIDEAKTVQIPSGTLIPETLTDEATIVKPEDSVYIIYTSGTTGNPKGVDVMHKGLVNYALWSAAHHSITPDDVALQLVAFHFDGFGANIYPALISGAAIVLILDECKLNTAYIAKTIEQNKVTNFAMVPGLYGELLDELEPLKNNLQLRFVILAGELAGKKLIEKSYITLPGLWLQNQYGPTEATIGATQSHKLTTENNTTIGSPIWNTDIFILGKGGELLPEGVTGEMYIGGKGVARGYIGNALLSAERFIAHINGNGQLLYRTGDLARWNRETAVLEFLGRTDHQIKIRGYRVEPAEIESHLATYPGINEVTVQLSRIANNDILAAYYTGTIELAEEAIRGYLGDLLPSYMVPGVYVRLEAMPLTATGKLDRKALPLPVQKTRKAGTAPQGDQEMLLAGIWSQVLGVESPDREDDFFASGGDSIKSIQIISRLQRSGYKLSVKDIFSQRTIARLALQLELIAAGSGTSQEQVKGEVLLSPVQRWFLATGIKKKEQFNQSVLLDFPGGLERVAVDRVFSKLAEHHDALRMYFLPLEGPAGVMQQHCRETAAPLEIQEDELKGLSAIETASALERLGTALQSGMSLETGPLLKLGMYHLEDGSSRLLIAIHHLVVDGISWRILFEDIETLYNQYQNNETLRLPAKTSSYQKWSREQQERISTAPISYKKNRAYWAAQQSTASPAALPGLLSGASDRSTDTLANASAISFRLDAAETAALLGRVHGKLGTEVNDLLLSGLLLALERGFGCKELLLDMEGHGREETEQGTDISRTVGWFTSIYPVQLSVSGDTLLKKVRQVKSQLRSVPRGGQDYLLYRYGEDHTQNNTDNNTKNTTQYNHPLVSFNYLGQFDADTQSRSYRMSAGPRGQEIAIAEVRLYDWEFSGLVSGGELELSLRYGSMRYDAKELSRLMEHYRVSLQELISAAGEYEGPHLLSPAELSYPGLGLTRLEALQEQYELEDIYGLSPMQEGMLFHALLDSGSDNYFEQMRLRISGELNVGAVEKSLNTLANRYAVLRTLFVHEGYERPLQVVLKTGTIAVQQEDLRDINEAEQKDHVSAWQSADKARGFELSKPGGLMRVGVLQLAADSYELIWSHHHILMDGWCMGIILNEFRQLYSSHVKGKPIKLGDTEPYSNYIGWLQEQDSKAALDYWKDYLAGYEGGRQLPVRRTAEQKEQQAAAQQAGQQQSYRQGSRELELGSDQTNQLQAMCSRLGITLSTLLQGAWGLLLGRYYGDQDVVFGSVVSGRGAPVSGIETMVGLLINTIPVRVQAGEGAEAGKTVGELLQELQETALVSEAWHHCPLAHIQSVSKAGSQLFDHLMVFENFPLQIENQEVEFNAEVQEIFESNHYNLTIFIYPGENLKIQFIYDANKYDENVIKSFPEYFESVINQVITNIDKSVETIELLTDDEKQEVFNQITRYEEHPLMLGDTMPASYHQERLWFIDKFESGYLYKASPVYHNMPLILNLEGDVNYDLLEKSLQKVINKYQILRTQIITVNERPLQRVAKAINVTLQLTDVASTVYPVETIIDEFINTPFKVDETLVRASLLKKTDNKYALILVVHHILADRPSMVMLAREILSVYDSFLTGNQNNEAALTLPYQAFALWQKEALEKLEPQLLGYWRKQLGNEIKPLEIPTDRQRVAVHIYKASSSNVSIPKILTQKVKALADKEGVNIGVFLMATFKVLLYKYAGHEEIVIGTSTSNRQQHTANLIGPASNLIVIRSNVMPDAEYSTYLHELNSIYKDGLHHQQMPFDKLVTKLAPKKDMSRTALFDVLYQYEDAIKDLPAITDLRAHIEDVNLGHGKYDINLFLQGADDQINGKLVYNQEYFNAGTIEAFINHYLNLLEQVCGNPTVSIAALNPVGAEEQNEILKVLDNSQVDYPKEKTVVDLFEQQVQATPDKVAVSFQGEHITYAELNKKAEKLAWLLQQKGVSANQIIGLFTERSIETVIGMLAIIKAGGAYLPLDIDYPAERINYIIKDSGISLMLTTGNLLDKIDYEIESICIESADQIVPSGQLLKLATPADLCYIIYTSGTTGNPKGVMVEHRNVVRLLFNDAFQFNFNENDVWTMFHSHCFDFSVWEMYGALLFGGRVIIIPKVKAIDTKGFLKLLKDEKVTVLNQTPSAFYNLIKEELALPTNDLHLKYVIFGGEALFPAKLKGWYNKYPDVQLINMFGITETTVHVTYKEIGSYEIDNNISNIGKPIPTLSVYILDGHKNIVPKGVSGELYVGGAGVSRGYWGKEKLTNEKFIANPFKAGERLYKSGDAARMLDSGDIEYIGRIDNQIQLRGFRIELGEIESRLAEHDEIEKAVAILKTQDENNYIAAYYVANQPISTTKLRQFLTDKLPDYMVPSYIIHLTQLPLTANGKLDRSALPNHEVKIDSDFEKAQNDIQQQLISIWSDVLQVEEDKISVNINFFELGGHSINIIKLNNKINELFGVEIAIAEMFRLPTIKMIEEHIRKGDVGLKDIQRNVTETIDEAMANLNLLGTFTNN
jgi:iturin family lipopeptide synthetase A